MPTNPSYQFSPVIEGPTGFLPGLPSRLIESGNFSTVEFIGGHCTNDGRTFAGGAPEDFVTDSDIKRLVFSRWPAVVYYLLSLYHLPPSDKCLYTVECHDGESIGALPLPADLG